MCQKSTDESEAKLSSFHQASSVYLDRILHRQAILPLMTSGETMHSSHPKKIKKENHAWFVSHTNTHVIQKKG